MHALISQFVNHCRPFCVLRRFTLALILGVICTGVLHAQRATAREGFEVRSIEFEGNDEVQTKELMKLLQTRETPGWFNKFLYSLGERLGRPDEYFDPTVFAEDAARVRQYYRDHGFHGARIDSSLTFSSADTTVDVKFLIEEGYRSTIDSIRYLGLAGAPEGVFEELASGERIKDGDPFNQTLLEEEVKRVLLILFNAGYPDARFARDRSSATRFLSSGNYKVALSFEIGRRHWFGTVSSLQEGDTTRTDITDDIILSQLDYQPGERFSQDNLKSSERNLNRLGVFDLARIDTFRRSAEKPDTIFSLVTFRPRDRHEFAPELSLSDEDRNLNIGVGMGYTTRNFLGGARTFSTRLRYRTQTLGFLGRSFSQNSEAVANVDLTFELLQPYVFTNNIKGSWSFSLVLDKQKAYIQRIVRNKFGFTDRFAEFTTGFLDWTLERVELGRNLNFTIDSTNAESVRQLGLLTAQASQIQFNSIITFTIQRDMTNDVFSPSSGFYHSATFEESGLLPLILNPGLPFTQFGRVILFGRWYWDLTDHRFSLLALKLRAGYEDKYGESAGDPERAIPQAHRFYAGGGGGVRGWRARDLSAVGDPELGGNVSFEGSMELRTNILQNLKDDFWDKLWTVAFVDWGNVWARKSDLQFRSVAIAAGIGLRYETFFGPFRIDYGFRVYDPRGDAAGKRWVTERNFFGQTFREGVFHFGIGHAF